ncbi:UNVERIFIED_CONTAM: hypothetical protein PYX00_011886 [Menopon gallinae]|uniref:GPI mannosyltransferase 2 n=1 Tax=Menopon gallinae TaxID=328185 RepID=A0AAW2H8L3_9NEOP
MRPVYDLGITLAVAAVSRVFYILVAYVSSRAFLPYDKSTLLVDSSPLSFLLRWDAINFYIIASRSYITEHITAFFPLYPMLVRLLHRLSGIGILQAGIAVSNTSFCLSAPILYCISIRRYSRRTSLLSVALFCFNPASIVYCTLYAESLFALLFLLSFLFLELGSAKFVLFSALCTLTRSNGILFVLFPLLGFRPAIALLSVLLHVVPFALFQLYVFVLMRRFDTLLPYTYVQSVYWEQGFLRFYMDTKNIPNAMVAFPFVSFSLYLLLSYARSYRKRCKNTIVLMALLAIQTFMAIFFIHSQMFFRFVSFNPLIYWSLAHMIEKKGLSGMHCVLVFYLAFGAMETASHLDPDEERSLQMAVLSKVDPKKAECALKAYLKEKRPLALVYKLLPLDFLKKSCLVDGNVIKSLAKINTRRHFVQRRVFFIEQDTSSYGMVYSGLVHFAETRRKNTARLLRQMLRIVDPLKAIDILSRLVLLPRLPFEYKKMVELFYLLSSHGQKMSLLFVRNAFLLKNDTLSRHVLKMCNYGLTEFGVLAEVDLDFCKRHFRNFCTNKGLLGVFLRHVPSSEFLAYRRYFDAEVLLNNLEKISLLDAQEFSLQLKNGRIFTDYWGVVSTQEPFARFLRYEMLGESQNVFDETKRLLKRLSLGNVEIIYAKMEALIHTSPPSYFKAMIETIYSYDTLLCVLEKTLFCMPPIFIDILYFCVLRILVTRSDIVSEGRYQRWYLNLCSLFRIIMPLVQLDAAYTVLEKFFELRRYAHIPLLEVVVQRHIESRSRAPGTRALSGDVGCLALPDTLISHISDAVNDVFLYESHPLELKVDISERYRKVCETLGGGPPCTVDLCFGNLKYLTPYEVALAARCIEEEQLNKVVGEFKDTYGGAGAANHAAELSQQDFFTVKNFILLVNILHSSVLDIDWIIKYLGGIRDIKRSDLRLLGESCLSNILVDMRKNKKQKRMPEDMHRALPSTGRHGDKDTSEMERHESQKSSQEEGEIRE